MAQFVRKGTKLGEANDIMFANSYSKCLDSEFRKLTDQLMGQQLYVQTVVLAV